MNEEQIGIKNLHFNKKAITLISEKFNQKTIKIYAETDSKLELFISTNNVSSPSHISLNPGHSEVII